MSQMHTKLMKKEGATDEEVSEILTHLTETGALSDERFARAYARHLWLTTTQGPKKMEQSLYARGVSGGVARSILAEEFTEEEIFKRVEKLCQNVPETKIARQKKAKSLMSKGYSWDTVSRVLGL